MKALCSPDICHRTEGIEIDTADATITLSLRQWRNGWPEELKPGWLPPRISWFVSHKEETIDFGFPEGGPIIVHASEPMALSVHFVLTPEEIRELMLAMTRLITRLTGSPRRWRRLRVRRVREQLERISARMGMERCEP